MTSLWPSLLASLGLSITVFQAVPGRSACADGWTPRPGRTVRVKSVAELEQAVGSARSGDTLLLAEGDYALRRTIDITTANVTIRGRQGDPHRVVLHGQGMTGDRVGVALSISAPGVAVADLTIRDVGFHAIQVRGERGASGFVLHHARVLDTGQQLLKVSVAARPLYADDGLVACSDFSYTTSAPSDYTNGVDVLAGKGWVIRDNRFTRIRGPEAGGWASGPTILAWKASEDTLVERNVIVDSFRGIALGLTADGDGLARHRTREYDHLRGIVRNNVIVNLNSWADEAIEANAARDARIEHNTVLVQGGVSWSIAARFPSASALIRNNLTNRQILSRNGGQLEDAGNVTNAAPGWFVDPGQADLHLGPGGDRAIDAGIDLPDVTTDFDRAPRRVAPDAGAFEAADRPAAIRP